MRVELALFDGDVLLDRGEITVSPEQATDTFKLFRAHHRIGGEGADVVLDGFADHVDLKRVSLDVPIHESGDWESIDVGKYTLAFWCHLMPNPALHTDTRKREEVLAAVAGLFPETEVPAVMQILDGYGAQSGEPERERVQLAILKLSEGQKSRLQHYVDAARRDYRDVLYWSENPA